MQLRTALGAIRPAWAPILLTYFCYGASAVIQVGDVFFQKRALGLEPAEVAAIAFWLGLPWSMKMVAGVASDVHPIFGSRRVAYLLLGALCSLIGFAALATIVDTKASYLVAMLLVTVGFMVQDVVADALSVEVAQTEEEIQRPLRDHAAGLREPRPPDDHRDDRRHTATPALVRGQRASRPDVRD
ncbi:MAG: PucC family protein [Candidatus Rokubacteria bacterium]|nr:PucC family protein [Candidatus Rokubacteria bacterium]